jgi:hypothetical protein
LLCGGEGKPEGGEERDEDLRVLLRQDVPGDAVEVGQAVELPEVGRTLISSLFIVQRGTIGVIDWTV